MTPQAKIIALIALVFFTAAHLITGTLDYQMEQEQAQARSQAASGVSSSVGHMVVPMSKCLYEEGC